MKLGEFIKQRHQNTVYLSPEFGIGIEIRNKKLFNKCEEIAKTMHSFYSFNNLKLINDLFDGLHVLGHPDLQIENFNEILGIEEIGPIIKNILVLNQELENIINCDKEILSHQNISPDEFKSVIKVEVPSFTYKLYEILLQKQINNMILEPYNVFKELDFYKCYKIFENYLYAEYQCYKFFLEFQNLEIENDMIIDLDDHLKIKKLDDLEMYLILNRRKDIFNYRPGIIENPVLEISFKTRKNKGYDMKNKRERESEIFCRNLSHSSEYLDSLIFDVLTVLRLSNINYVGFKREFSMLPGISSFCHESLVPNLYSLPYSNHKEKFIINKDLKYKIIETYLKYSIAKTIPKISAAIRRFNFAYERKFDEDKVIDYFTSIETLFDVKQSRNKGVLLGKEIAEKIGIDNLDKRIIKKRIKKYYRLRNTIIHSNHEVDKKKLNEVHTFLEVTVRKILNVELQSIS